MVDEAENVLVILSFIFSISILTFIKVRSQAAPNDGNISSDRIQELNSLISALEHGDATVAAVQRLALICTENTVAEFWEENKAFERFFKALMSYLQPTRVSSLSRLRSLQIYKLQLH